MSTPSTASDLPASMKAVRFAAYGGPEVLRLEDVPLPALAEDDVLVRVAAAAINPADIQFRRGDYQAFVPLPLPFTPGWDVAGTVVATGARATRWRAGDRVFAMTDMSRPGAYAEFVAVRERELAAAPASLAPAQAAGIPLAALTAWAALFDHGGLAAGQRVLVHAGAGGVGQFAIQLARRAGAHVIATASAANLGLLRALGAHEAIDYRAGDFAATLRDVDVVLDTVGGDTRERSWRVLRPGGILCAVAMPPPGATIAQAHGVRQAIVAVQPDGGRLGEIARLVDQGELRVVIDSEFPLADAADAHRLSEGGHARGKIVLRVGENP